MTTNDSEIFRTVLEQSSEGVIIINANDEIIFMNRVAEEVRGVSADEKVGRSVALCHSEKSYEKVKRALQYLRREETKTFTRMVVDHKKGRYYENAYAPIRDKANNYIGSIIISRDITDRRRLEEERVTHLQDLEEKVDKLTGELQDLFISSMTSLVNTLEAKDPYTKGHSLRVCEISVKIAEHIYGVSKESREVELAGKLHDIGKVGVREVVLDKPGRLTEEEFYHIKEHPVIGERILIPIDRLKPITKVIRHHHERFNGTGYPDGLTGEEIPLGSRILTIADSYDAMISARPYRPSMAPENAAEEIKKCLGTQYDPQFGEVFLELHYSGTID